MVGVRERFLVFKYRRKLELVLVLFWGLSVLESGVGEGAGLVCGAGNGTEGIPCWNGHCVGKRCVCHPGFMGVNCQHCYGKTRLEGKRGMITDGVGNYTANMKCTWLIEAEKGPIYLKIEDFATECGWDWLYIYDGDNVYSPLLGVFSGILLQRGGGYSALRNPEVVAKSGFALVHFYTDMAYNLTGFNISYRSESCPSNNFGVECSGNGKCVNSACLCNERYTGVACNTEKCPKNCSNNGVCDVDKGGCRCKEGFGGNDCSREQKGGYWEVLLASGQIPKGTASHASILYNNSIWVFGGHMLDYDMKDVISIFKYDITENTWEKVLSKSETGPGPLYGHTCVLFEGKVYLYGGVHGGQFASRDVSNSVWAFDLNSRKWSKVTARPEKCRRGMCGPLDLVGHSAVVVSEKGNKSRHSRMVVISGHSPRYSYVNVVQEFHFGSGNWNVVTTKGYPFPGSFGHSSNWDPISQKIYVFGGYQVSQDSTSAALSSSLFSYDPSSHNWQLLENAPQERFLHGAAVFQGLYFIIGGNGHNDTLHWKGSKCYTSDVLIYDIACDSWSTLNPLPVEADVSRYGHSVVVENAIYIYGGFSGVMHNDVVRYSPTTCGFFTSQTECSGSVKYGVKCNWNRAKEQCENFVGFVSHSKEKEVEKNLECSRGQGRKLEEICSNFPTCSSCLQNKLECVWCGGNCQSSKCKDVRHQPVTSLEQCKEDDSLCRLHLNNCPLCLSELGCVWGKDDRCTKEPVHKKSADTSMSIDRESSSCDQACPDYSTCFNCTSNNCMWCDNLNTCVGKNAYVISFPFGECMSWSQLSSTCHSKDPRFSPSRSSMCDEVATCDACLALPSCGWCDNGSGTGKGRCMDGSSRGPLDVKSSRVSINETLCPKSSWHFTGCPACQCNGHSTCDENFRCKSCEGFTEGDHCENCIQGYYGKAINGGSCNPCECNGQADFCHTETGRCFCTTKGITGEDCKKCDTQNNYSGDPNNSSCFYELQIDYQFTFNLSKKEDQYYNKINFRNTPNKRDIDADFQITCSVMAKMNISYTRAGHDELYIVQGHNCTTFKHRFSRDDFNFGPPDNVTFFVYVYDFRPPLWIQISFSQNPKLDLLHFFVTFSTCFLALLILAAFLWKVKQRYDMYRRRQRLFVEMEAMASRPFAQVFIELGQANPLSRLSSLRRRRKDAPSPIALEPCVGNRAAVLSLLITLPTGSHQFSPPGQSGLAVGSTLVALGNPRKASFEPASNKTEGKGKGRKSLPSHGLNNCI